MCRLLHDLRRRHTMHFPMASKNLPRRRRRCCRQAALHSSNILLELMSMKDTPNELTASR